MSQEIKEAIEILEKILKPLDACEPQCKLNLNPEKIRQAVTKLKAEQPPASEFMKEIKSTGLMEYKSTKHSIIKLQEACVIIDQLQARLDRAEASKADLLTALEQIAVLNAGKDNDIQWLCTQAKEKEG